MAARVHLDNYPGMSVITVNFGLGHAPRNTTPDQIRTKFTTIPGVDVDSAGGFRILEGVWSITRRTDSKTKLFTPEEIAKVRVVAEFIASKG